MNERDLFANFDRMRREVDELFGDVFERTGLARRRGGFSPAVDIVYRTDPPRAIVTAELAGVDVARLGLLIEGRRLLLTGTRPAPAVHADDVYQQVEIGRGPFRRVVELAQDVQVDQVAAEYRDGILTVELPLRSGAPSGRTVPIETIRRR
jgi:HSP20 family protein